jgi:hypothetical protein
MTVMKARQSSTIEEIYLSNESENFQCRDNLDDTINHENENPLLCVTVVDNLFIRIPRLDEATTKPNVKTFYPLTYEGLLKWNKNDQSIQIYSSSSEEEDCYSSDCEDLVNDENITIQRNLVQTASNRRAEFVSMREKEELCVDQFKPVSASVLLKEVEDWEWGLKLDDDQEPEMESQSAAANELMFFNWGDDYNVNPNGGWEKKCEEDYPDVCNHPPDDHEEEEWLDDSEYSDDNDEEGCLEEDGPEGDPNEAKPLVSDIDSDDEIDIDYI